MLNFNYDYKLTLYQDKQTTNKKNIIFNKKPNLVENPSFFSLNFNENTTENFDHN